MKTLSTEVNEQSVIIFIDKSKKWVTKQQAEVIIEQSCQPNKTGILINGSFYTFKSISKILSDQDYYTEFPEERPTANVFEELYGGTRDYTQIEITAEQHQDQFRGILRGLKSYIDEQLAKGITPKNALAIYEQKLAKFKLEFAK